MINKKWFETLGRYIEAPPVVALASSDNHPSSDNDMCHKAPNVTTSAATDEVYYRLIHSIHDTPATLRLAADLRFFYALLRAGGHLRLCRTKIPLVTYRHRRTSRSPKQVVVKNILSVKHSFSFASLFLLDFLLRFCVSSFFSLRVGQKNQTRMSFH